MKLCTKEQFGKFLNIEKQDDKFICLYATTEFDEWTMFHILNKSGVSWAGGQSLQDINYCIYKNNNKPVCMDEQPMKLYRGSIKWFEDNNDKYEIYLFNNEILI